MAVIATEEAAGRLARVILSDVELYARERPKNGESLDSQIEEGRRLFASRVSPEMLPIFEAVLATRKMGAAPAAPPKPAAAPIATAAAPVAVAAPPPVVDPPVPAPVAADLAAPEPIAAAPAAPEPTVAAPAAAPEPMVAALELTAPEVTAPEVTAPEVTAPEVTAPEVTAPEITDPVAFPQETAADSTGAASPSDDITAPGGSEVDDTIHDQPTRPNLDGQLFREPTPRPSPIAVAAAPPGREPTPRPSLVTPAIPAREPTPRPSLVAAPPAREPTPQPLVATAAAPPDSPAAPLASKPATPSGPVPTLKVRVSIPKILLSLAVAAGLLAAIAHYVR